MTVGVPQLERYRLGELLGAGGMALVYRGYDRELARPVAVKLLADNLAGDPAFRQRFLREARAAARLSHPNVVQIYDVGELDGRPYFVMEYVEGETVAQHLHRRGRLPAIEVLAIALGVSAGLEHAHEAGVVHRDIKPQNLLLPAVCGVKIADFGIARTLDGTAITEIGTLLGTAAYAAPEQVAGLPVTAAADIYALGVVIFELASGTSPFAAETLTQTFLSRGKTALPSLLDTGAGVAPALDDVISRCLSATPENRPTARELQTELADIAVGLDPAVPLPRGPVEQPRLSFDSQSTSVRTRVIKAEGTKRDLAVRRHPSRMRVASVVALASVVLLVALAVFLHLRGGGQTGPTRSRPTNSTPAPVSATAQARALSAWLRANSQQ